MKKLNLAEISKLELAIVEKYGKLSATDPRDCYDEAAQEAALEMINRRQKQSDQLPERIDNGIVYSSRGLFRVNDNYCIVCAKTFFDHRNCSYVLKYRVCERCFIKHVEGRSDKWREKLSKLDDKS